MVKHSKKQLDGIFHALADSTRRDMVERLSFGSRDVSALAKEYRISLPAVSKHLKVLKQAGLVNFKKTGRQNIFSLNAVKLLEAREWMRYWSKFWNNELDNLEKYLLKK